MPIYNQQRYRSIYTDLENRYNSELPYYNSINTSNYEHPKIEYVETPLYMYICKLLLLICCLYFSYILVYIFS